MKFVNVNGVVIHFSDRGRPDAPPIVFINSLGTDFRIWTEVAEILAPEFRIVLYDKRGHGLSRTPRSYDGSPRTFAPGGPWKSPGFAPC